MEFDKPYKRETFISFLQQFLPEDASLKIHKKITPSFQAHFASSVTDLGSVESLNLKIYEIKHGSVHDARVGLSKDAFRLLSEEAEERALVIFVPEDSNDVYRFSFIELSLECTEKGSLRTSYSNPRRYSYKLGTGIAYHTPNKYLNQAGRVSSAEDLKKRFSVEILTKEFYSELSDWYAWAVKILRFPNNLKDSQDQEKYNHEAAIRLITRLIFVWFLKQRHLVPSEFFDEDFLSEKILKNFSPNLQDLAGKSWDSVYYKAILQNLFFAMLNCPLTQEGKNALTERKFRESSLKGGTSKTDNESSKVMRHKDLFKDPVAFLHLSNSTVPFLNGGLFDCLDDSSSELYLDGFSDDPKVHSELIAPDFLFFGEEVGKDIDLSEWYGDSKKKKVSARGIIDILKRYNFTVEENTPFDQDISLDPELLGKVFENLLASYNPETQVSARKQTGSFYTPREIVQFMVNESLISYLKRTVGSEFESEFRKLIQVEDSIINLDELQKRAVVKALFNCKVLDPACGSGAFPVGILQQMVHILQQLDSSNSYWKKLLVAKATEETSIAYGVDTEDERRELLADIERSFNESINMPDYARKLYLIENCIFGIDIQPIAIQIAKLRFFISLIVDQKANSDPRKNFGIRPLPNLEAKFVAADSLKSLDRHESDLFDLNEIQDKQDQLKLAKHKIFGAKTLKTKKKYKEKVNDLRKELAQSLLKNNFINNLEAEELASWDMFDQNACAPFFDPEWMFGIKDGFDIVLGNPPYIQLQANKGFLATKYEDCGFDAFARTGDIYCLFYNRGTELLCQNGVLCFITSNKWMRAGYGEKLRNFLRKHTNPSLLLDFGGIQVFESATVDTNILLATKSSYTGKTKSVTLNKNSLNCFNNLSDFIQQKSNTLNFNFDTSWVVLSPIEQSIKSKIEAVGVPLKDWNIEINYGIKTGCNEAFIVNSEKRQEILSLCKNEEERKRTAELIRPILRGRDIKQYGYQWAGLYLIATFPSCNYDLTLYPALKKYLSTFAEQELRDNGYDWVADKYLASFCTQKLEQSGTTIKINGEEIQFSKKVQKSRKKTTNKWFETQDNISYWDNFSKPKLLYSDISTRLNFVYSEEHIFCNNTVYFITSDRKEELLYLQNYLNSPLMDWYYRTLSVQLGEETVRLFSIYVLEIPIPKHSGGNIYQTFALSPEEINFIESQYSQ